MPYPPYQIRFKAGTNVQPGPNEVPGPGEPLTEPFKMDPDTGGIRGSHRVKAKVPGGMVTLDFTHFDEPSPIKPNLIVNISHAADGGGPLLKKKAAAKRAKKARPAKAAKRAKKAGGRKTSGKRR